ncbi:MAG: hypothetical protein EOO41_03250 [Methanobacteriota archaeon]|nr:MAG: hypothetical protein EOO41_03250 [Euryarchaeota archaeon]
MSDSADIISATPPTVSAMLMSFIPSLLSFAYELNGHGSAATGVPTSLQACGADADTTASGAHDWSRCALNATTFATDFIGASAGVLGVVAGGGSLVHVTSLSLVHAVTAPLQPPTPLPTSSVAPASGLASDPVSVMGVSVLIIIGVAAAILVILLTAIVFAWWRMRRVHAARIAALRMLQRSMAAQAAATAKPSALSRRTTSGVPASERTKQGDAPSTTAILAALQCLSPNGPLSTLQAAVSGVQASEKSHRLHRPSAVHRSTRFAFDPLPAQSGSDGNSAEGSRLDSVADAPPVLQSLHAHIMSSLTSVPGSAPSQSVPQSLAGGAVRNVGAHAASPTAAPPDSMLSVAQQAAALLPADLVSRIIAQTLASASTTATDFDDLLAAAVEYEEVDAASLLLQSPAVARARRRSSSGVAAATSQRHTATAVAGDARNDGSQHLALRHGALAGAHAAG